MLEREPFEKQYPCTQSIAPFPHYFNYNQHHNTPLTFNRDLDDIEDIPFLYNYIDPPTTNKQRTTLFVTASCQKYTAVNATICPLIPDWLSLIDTSKICTFQANGLACQAKYEAGSIPSFAANASLFVKAHAY